MVSPSHLIGGAVFTGTMCAFNDINIFSDWKYLSVCAFFSLLPDIDSTKSIFGKLFFPIAWIINRKFGHRTLTHSLLFLLFIYGVLFALSYFGIIIDKNFIKIALFAFTSHLIFDMFTISGVPLFYPFFMNPCVIPGNPAFRFKSGDLRSEIVVCGVCGLLCFTMQPLFSNGFWTSYNRYFATIKHVDRENSNTEFYVTCEYSYIKNAQTFQGQALVIESSVDELLLFDNSKIFKLSQSDPQLKINYVKPFISDVSKRFNEVQFFNIGLDSLQNMLSDKLVSGSIQSNYNVYYIEDAISYQSNFIKLSNRYDFQIFASADTSKAKERLQISKLQASINQYNKEYNIKLSEYQSFINEINSIENLLNTNNLDNYERNKNQRLLMQMRNKNNPKPVYVAPASQLAEIESLKHSLSDNQILFSGHFTLFQFGETVENEEIKPIFEVSKAPLLTFINLQNTVY
jgi:Predicted membrane-bound metal-dependent hydrolases